MVILTCLWSVSFLPLPLSLSSFFACPYFPCGHNLPITNLVVGMSDMLLPIITNVVNSSLSLGHFPSDWKTALVDPRLKKTKQGTSLSNLRPVSNLQYLSKLVESAVYDTKCSLWYESLIRIEPFFFLWIIVLLRHQFSKFQIYSVKVSNAFLTLHELKELFNDNANFVLNFVLLY